MLLKMVLFITYLKINKIDRNRDWLNFFIAYIIHWLNNQLGILYFFKSKKSSKKWFFKIINLYYSKDESSISINSISCKKKKNHFMFSIYFFEFVDTNSLCIISLETLYKHHLLFYDKMLYLSLLFLCIYF